MTKPRRPPYNPLTASRTGPPTELPPRSFLTNDERLMQIRSRDCTPREAEEEYYAQQERSSFG